MKSCFNIYRGKNHESRENREILYEITKTVRLVSQINKSNVYLFFFFQKYLFQNFCRIIYFINFPTNYACHENIRRLLTTERILYLIKIVNLWMFMCVLYNRTRREMLAVLASETTSYVFKSKRFDQFLVDAKQLASTSSTVRARTMWKCWNCSESP